MSAFEYLQNTKLVNQLQDNIVDRESTLPPYSDYCFNAKEH